MQRRIWTVSNYLSFSRILLAVPVALLVAQNDPSQRWLLAALIFVAAMTDLFDGIIARRLNQVTELGKIIDPVADKVAVGAVCIILVLDGRLPLWFVALIIVRDLLILSGGILVRRRYRTTLQSNVVGKWAVTVIAATILLTVLQYPGLSMTTSIFIAVSTLMLLISFILYLKRFLSVARGANQSGRVNEKMMVEISNSDNNV